MGNRTEVNAYKMDLTNKLGEGAFGRVYKITTYDKKTECAAKIFKTSYEKMEPLEKLGYGRELKILQETSHPFVIKYMEDFLF